MKLYRVKVRNYFDDKGWRDAQVLIEAESLGAAMEAGREWGLGVPFFGQRPERVQSVEAAGVSFPYPL